MYNDVDIALDPFPYGGMTTSLEAIYMGVPVFTMVGDSFLSRGTYSLNKNLGLEEYIASNEQEYISKIINISNNIDKIQSADLCIIKDVLMHWPLEYIYSFLDSIISSKKYKHIMLINCAWQKRDNTTIKMGQHRPLSMNFLPLKKYAPTLLLKYNAKEVLLITVDCLN